MKMPNKMSKHEGWSTVRCWCLHKPGWSSYQVSSNRPAKAPRCSKLSHTPADPKRAFQLNTDGHLVIFIRCGISLFYKTMARPRIPDCVKMVIKIQLVQRQQNGQAQIKQWQNGLDQAWISKRCIKEPDRKIMMSNLGPSGKVIIL